MVGSLFLCLSLPALAAPPKPVAAQPSSATSKPAARQRANASHAKARHARRAAALERAGIRGSKAKRALEIIDRFESERRAGFEDLKRARSALASLIETNSSNESAYSSALRDLRRAADALRKVNLRELDALGKVLKPSELSRYIAEKAHSNQLRRRKARAPQSPS